MADDQLDDALMDLLWESDLPFGPDSVGNTSLPAPPQAPSPIDPWDDLRAKELVIADAVESDKPNLSEAATVPQYAWSQVQYALPNRRPTAKDRIQILKEEVVRLQAALETVYEQSKHTEPTTRSMEEGQVSPSSLAGGMWQSIAARQQQQREQAETENKRLRSLVHAQRRHLQNVRRLLGRRPHRHVSLDDDASGLIEMATHPFTSIARCGAFNRR
jgi:hypothetical protein